MADKDLEARFDELSKKNAQLTAALEAQMAAGTAGIGAEQLEAILTRTSKAASAGSELLASKMKPENADHRHLGPFEHPEGGIEKPKPSLLRETWFGPFRQRETELTYAEVEAFNLLNASMARGQKRLARDGKWNAVVSDNNERLTITFPMKTGDERGDLPGITQIALEMHDGLKALDPNDLAQEVALLRAQVAAMQGATA